MNFYAALNRKDLFLCVTTHRSLETYSLRGEVPRDTHQTQNSVTSWHMGGEETWLRTWIRTGALELDNLIGDSFIFLKD